MKTKFAVVLLQQGYDNVSSFLFDSRQEARKWIKSIRYDSCSDGVYGFDIIKLKING